MYRKPKWWVPFVRPPLLIVRAVLSPLYHLSFDWLDRRLAKKREERLARDVQLAMKFLFTDHGARIVPNEGVRFPPSFDYAFVTVALDDVFIRFCRGRGELSVSVASRLAPSKWRDLTFVMDPLMNEPVRIREGDFRDLWEVARILQPAIRNLTAERFRQLKQRLES